MEAEDAGKTLAASSSSTRNIFETVLNKVPTGSDEPSRTKNSTAVETNSESQYPFCRDKSQKPTIEAMFKLSNSENVSSVKLEPPLKGVLFHAAPVKAEVTDVVVSTPVTGAHPEAVSKPVDCRPIKSEIISGESYQIMGRKSEALVNPLITTNTSERINTSLLPSVTLIKPVESAAGVAEDTGSTTLNPELNSQNLPQSSNTHHQNTVDYRNTADTSKNTADPSQSVADIVQKITSPEKSTAIITQNASSLPKDTPSKTPDASTSTPTTINQSHNISNLLISAQNTAGSSPNTSYVTQNTSIVTPNTANVTQNAPIVTQNTSLVTQNPSNVIQNTSLVTQNPSNVIQNTSTVTQNPASVTQNPSNVTQNTNNVTQNTANVTQNTSNITKNPSMATQNTSNVTQYPFNVTQNTVNKPPVKTEDTNPVVLTTDGTILERVTEFPLRCQQRPKGYNIASTFNIIPYKVPSVTTGTSQKPYLLSGDSHGHIAVTEKFPANIIPLKCKYCEYLCATEEVFKQHLSQHQKDFHHQTCPVTRCKFRYTVKADILKHYREIHGDPESIFSCIDCAAVTRTTEALSAHREKHFKKRPYACNICFKTFIKMSSLRCHNTKTHRGDPRIKDDFFMRADENSDEDYVAPISEEMPTEVRYSKRKRTKLAKEVVFSEPDELGEEEEDESEGVVEEAAKDVEVKTEKLFRSGSGNIEGIPKMYQILTPYVFLECAFCETTLNSKKDLANHLITSHGDQVINASDALIDL